MSRAIPRIGDFLRRFLRRWRCSGAGFAGLGLGAGRAMGRAGICFICRIGAPQEPQLSSCCTAPRSRNRLRAPQ